MHCDRLQLGDDPAVAAAEIRALVPPPESVRAGVAEIIAEVRAGGDDAISRYVQRFDTGGAPPRPLCVEQEVLDGAAERLAPELSDGLQRAIDNVGAVAAGWLDGGERAVEFGEHTVRLRSAPVQRAAVYVPGGRAPYPSTVVMGVVTAVAAGVKEVAVCAPPGPDGELNPVVLAACRLTGARDVYRMGGAHGIAALAYGSQSVKPVDVIVGPGNLYVQEAKQQVFGQVGIDGFAGPSDLLVLAGDDADPEPLALDLLAQAEHGPGTLVVAVSSSPALLERLAARLGAAPDTGAVARLLLGGADAAVAFAQAFAPEHIELVGREIEPRAAEITRAGCVFVGSGAATAFGDYIAGSNHILPTGGAGRFASGLTPHHFRRTYSEVSIADATALARAAAPVARAEGFELHAQSMEARIGDNGAEDDEPLR